MIIEYNSYFSAFKVTIVDSRLQFSVGKGTSKMHENLNFVRIILSPFCESFVFLLFFFNFFYKFVNEEKAPVDSHCDSLLNMGSVFFPL